jgi:signal transduction histidine kinase/DNA-binding response OmpR family regulator
MLNEQNFIHTLLPYGLCFITLTSLFLVILINERKKMRLRNEFNMQKLENEKLKEIDKLKSRFFANLSHEFRTMLSLISGPLELIKKNIEQEQIRQNIPLRPYEQMKRAILQETNRKNLQVIYNNARLLSRLVTQLLDFSKMDTGQLALKTRPVEIISVLRNIVYLFKPYAANKNIRLNFKSKHEALFVYIDHDKFEVIINNILSNAVKFTPPDGNINVEITRIHDGLCVAGHKTDCVEVKISDTGIGIAAENIDRIFERFYQVDSKDSEKNRGLGIGLALTKELTELHHGKISVASEQGTGTVFTIQLPMGKDHLNESEIVAEYIEMIDFSEVSIKKRLDEQKSFEKQVSGTRILVVEDNQEMRDYIRQSLAGHFHIDEADNGETALQFTLKKMPDIIISDIMMPVMDGMTLCQKIKEDQRLNHIPIILLTAKSEAKDKVSGLEAGADDYIIKPFSIDELQARIKNLLQQREILRQKIVKELLIQPELKLEQSYDEKFVSRVKDIIQNNIDIADFSVEELSSQMALSRFHLSRKLKQVTGMSPSRFISEIRLQKAAHLIKCKANNISQIALDVGFENFTYFNRCFKERFGCPPSKYNKS